MATLSDYETALNACVANPTPANAAHALAVNSLLPKTVSSGGASMTRPDPPDWVKRLAASHFPSSTRVILGRPGYGDGR